jgi:hypothetical protein
VPTFDERVVEGGVYLISSVDVRFNFGTHLPSYHRYKFVFTQNTIVDPATNSFIPDQGFELIEANDVRKKGSSFRYLVGKYFFKLLDMIIYSIMVVGCRE